MGYSLSEVITGSDNLEEPYSNALIGSTQLRVKMALAKLSNCYIKILILGNALFHKLATIAATN